MAGFFDTGGREGDPPEPRSAGNIFTEDLGPLPVWGWLVVAVAAVFLYRKIVGGGSSSSSSSSSPYPAAQGSVVVIPSAAGPAAPGGGIASSADVGTAYQYESKLVDQLATDIYQKGPGAIAPSIAGVSLYPFSDPMANARNIASQQLGLPYVNGAGAVVNPGTGQTLPLSTYQSLASSDPGRWEALALGRADAWNAILNGTGAGSSPGASAQPTTVTPILPGSATGPAPATPRYPATAPLPAGTCPAGLVLEVGQTGWTCATIQEHAALLAYLAAKKAA